MQFLLLLIIFPSFVAGGVFSYKSFQADSGVATVGGKSISRQEFDAAQREQIDRMRQMYGAQFDPKMLNTPEARKSILDNLIAQRALNAEVAKNHLSIPDQVLQQSILSTPGLVKPDGSFDVERYKTILASQGMTTAGYEQRLRQDLVYQQLVNAVQGSAFVPKTVATQLSALNEQEREVQALVFKAADYTSKVKVTDEMLKAYYDKNASLFEIPESIKAEYVVLSIDTIAAQMDVSDADVQSYYEQNKKTYGTEEERRASHILIEVKKDANDKDKAAAKAKAESLLAEVRKNPASFAKLAKENSSDTGSAERGGDLDFFGKGMMVKPFEEAAYKLKQGEISDVVQSDFGYHIIQLTAIKPATIKPLEEVKAAIVAEIKKQKASKAYAEAAETFTNTVYEQADSLKPVADKLKLKIQTVENLTRKPNPALPPSALTNNQKFLTAIFGDNPVKKKLNTDAVEVAPSTLVSGHIVEYKPAAKRPFEEVKAMITTAVTQTEAVALAKKEGEAKLQALKAADNTAGFSETKTISRLKNQDVPGPALSELFKADVQKLPGFVGIDAPGNGYVIYRIGRVNVGTPDEARRASERAQLDGAQAQTEMFSYVENLKKKAKVTITPGALEVQPASGADQ
ncbi:peptidylprolyl isomerase [Undibacterium terreum]|uniref:Periplasmic chaperone PpiD n=2 Tax=Undibacterium terreum TaxID=1224302 RepID=A0A916V0G1_9BURK|nr:peptidylprolyl isomerase [Undibacterium terreum]